MGKLGFDMEALFVEVLKKNGLEKPRLHNATPILIQSFSINGLKKLAAKYEIKWPLMWLTFVGTKWTPAMFDEAEKFAAAICPYKWDITASLVEQARARGLKVVAYIVSFRRRKGIQRDRRGDASLPLRPRRGRFVHG